MGFCLTLATAACADAPITAADLQSNGELRQGTQHVHSAETAAVTQRASHLRVTGVLAAQADGPLEDATRFSDEVEAIHLHLRVEDIAEPRPVTFVWTHDGVTRETLGFLQPSETLSLAASLPLVLDEREAAPMVEPMTGTWKVEVFSTSGPSLVETRSLLFEREFEILAAEQFEALASEPARGVAG
ncbi:hypothetical protein ACNOYE_07135 [Nannocystaceae bacterium ST9]